MAKEKQNWTDHVDLKGLGIAAAIIGAGLVGSYALAKCETQIKSKPSGRESFADKLKISNPFKK